MTDWPRIVSDLLASGLRRGDLAREVKAGVSTINDLHWGRASDPRHSLGVRLLDLHAARVQINNNNARHQRMQSREVERAKRKK